MKLKINSCSKTLCPPSWSWDTKDAHWYDYDLWVVLKGTGTIQTEDTVYNLSKGDCFCLRGGKRYIGHHNPSDPLTVIHIHFDYLDHENKPLRPSPTCLALYRRLTNLTYYETMLHNLLRAHSLTSFNTSTSATSEQWLSCILDSIHNDDQETTNRFSNTSSTLSTYIVERINKNLNEHHRIKDLATYFGYSSDHLSKVFKAEMGMTLEHYIIEKRIHRSTLLLSDSNMSIKEIAHALGYKDIYHFSKQFKKVINCSPSSYRKMIY